jgi:nucleoside-diphosphate-sugar epimerase
LLSETDGRSAPRHPHRRKHCRMEIFSRGHVENVAHAIKLAIEHDHAANQTFNVAEDQVLTS